ncbi:MAG: nucleoid-associated protein [Rhodothermaceae bacterium]
MEIKNAIIHKLEKERNAKSNLTLSLQVLTINESLNKLLSLIQVVYNRKRAKSYGHFENDTNLAPFSVILREHLNTKLNFTDFTKKSMRIFQNKIEKENFATGGFVLFIHYNNYLMVVMLNDKMSVAIKDGTLELEDTSHLDLENLHLSARLDITKWQSNDSNDYLSFIKGRSSQNKVSNYFLDFIGCRDYAEPKEQTQILLNVVDNFCSKKNYSDKETEAFKEKVFSYCDNKRSVQQPVNIELLSHYLDEENPYDFLEYANSEDFKLSNDFDIHRESLKKLRRFRYKDNSLILDFDRRLIRENKISIDYNNRSITITDFPVNLIEE